MLRYKFNGLAGCVVQRQLRLTGRLAGVYYAPEAKMDSSDGDWVTVCEEHGTRRNHKTLALAMAHLPCADWCEQCVAEVLVRQGAPLEPNQEISSALHQMARQMILGDESNPMVTLDRAETFLDDVIFKAIPDEDKANAFCDRISAILREVLAESERVR